jgi:uncharacterized protein
MIIRLAPGIKDHDKRRTEQLHRGLHLARCAAFLVLLTLFGGLTGCSFLKPAQPTARHFVLTPMLAPSPPPAASASIGVGVGRVKLPTYLFNTSFCIRKGTNEVEYLPSAFWAERLDTGFQRVLAANLSVLLPTDDIHLSAWQKEDITAEIYITIEQFDVNASGRGLLVARWRIVGPGGEKILKAGTSRLTRQGPKPDANVSGSITTLSELLADFSQELAQALQVKASSPKSAILH